MFKRWTSWWHCRKSPPIIKAIRRYPLEFMRFYKTFNYDLIQKLLRYLSLDQGGELAGWPLHRAKQLCMYCIWHLSSDLMLRALHSSLALSKLQHLWGKYFLKVLKTESYKLRIKNPGYIPFFIITISEALHSQVHCRHTIGMSTCPHCNEVQPCNLYIGCTLCPFIALRELKASWWVDLCILIEGCGAAGGDP